MTLKKTDILTSVFWVALFLLPILPQYIYVMKGVNVVNFLAVVFVLFFIAFGKIKLLQMPVSVWFFWLFVLSQSVFALVDSGILRMATYLLTCVVIPYLIICFIDNRERFYQTIDVLIGAGALIGVFGLLESITKINLFQPLANGQMTEFFYEVRYGLLRIMTTFGHPISYGIYQCFISALIVYRLSTDFATKNKKFYIIAFILSTLNIFLTVSRIPILMFIIIQILFAYKKHKRNFLPWFILVCLGILLIALTISVFDINIPFIDDLFATFRSFFKGETASSGETVGMGNRVELFEWVTKSMGNSWIFGKGFEAEFAYKVFEWQTKTSIENQYLNILYHTGLVGLITLLLSYLGILYFAKRMQKKHHLLSNEKSFSFASVIFIVLLVYFIAQFGVQETDITRIYVILVSLLIAYYRISTNPPASTPTNELSAMEAKT